MFPLLFLVVDSRIVDRYFFLSLGVDMSLSLVSFFSRQAAAKERKRNVTDQNYQKLRVASPAYINERRKERKEKKILLLLLLLLLLPVAHRIMVVIAGDVYLSSSCVYLLFKSKKQQNGHKVI
jgi:hypothetical protein